MNTYYVSMSGGDANPCATIAGACRTVQAAINRAGPGDVIRVAQGTYTDTAGSVALITESITLQGGWNASFTEHDPASYPTTLNARRDGPVVILIGPVWPVITPTIEGFIITGGDGTGVPDCREGDAVGCGGGIFGTNAVPQILSNMITDNIATTTGIGYGGGIYLQSGWKSGLISGNSVISNVAALSATGTVSGYGGGISLYDAVMVLQDNDISGNLAATGEGFGGGIYLRRSASTVYSNTIDNNLASSAAIPAIVGFGGGIYVWQSGVSLSYAPLIEANQLRGNVASLNGEGAGAGIGLFDTAAIITGNLIISNTSALGSDQRGNGGAIFGTAGSTWVLSNNRVFSNTASVSGRGFGGGFQLEEAEVTVEGNLIIGNTTSRATTSVHARGGGMNLLNCSGVVRHNVVRDNVAAVNSAVASYGGGISVNRSPLLVDGNVVVGNSATRWGGGVRVYEASLVTLTNNFITGNAAIVEGGGVHVNGTAEFPASALLIHNTLAENTQGAAGEAVYASGIAVVTMTNNIVFNHTIGIRNAGSPPNTRIVADYTLFNANGLNTSGTVANTHPVYGSPSFVDPSNEDYHIRANSPALDAGTGTWVSVDVDGDVRPLGVAVDVGADEAYVWGVELAPDRSTSALPGQTIHYEHTLTNIGNYTDTFLIAAASDYGWLSGYAPLSVVVGENLTATVITTVTVPTDALCGVMDRAVITATSQADGTAFDVAIDATTVSANYVAPDLMPSTRFTTADPEEVAVFTHTLINNSNIAETFTLEAVSTHGWPAAVSPAPTVPAFSSAVVTVTVTVPAGVTLGTSDTTTLTVSGTGGTEIARDTILAGVHFGVSLVPNHAAAIDPGIVLAYTHTLANTGNFTTALDISAVSDHGWFVLHKPVSVVLPVDGSTTVVVTVTVPGDVISGTVDTTVVTASVGLDAAVFDVVRDTHTVRRVAGVALEPGRRVDVRPGDCVILTHQLTNTGSYTDTFEIAAASVWLEAYTPPHITLKPWDSQTVVVTLTVPGGLVHPTVRTAAITATSQFHQGTFSTVQDSIAVVPHRIYVPLMLNAY